MFSRLNLKVRCERRRRNKSYTSTGLARKRLTRSPFAPWLLLLMILWKYPLPWCWLSPQPYKSTWAGSGWLEEAISNDWVARQSMANSGGASRVKLSQGMVIDSGRSKSSISLSRREKSMAINETVMIHLSLRRRKRGAKACSQARIAAIQRSLPFHCTGHILLYSYMK